MVEIAAPFECLAQASASLPVFLAVGMALCLVPFMFWLGRGQRFPGQRALLLAHLGVIWWLQMAALEFAVPTGPCKMLASGLSHLGIALTPLAWLCFVIRFTIGTRRLTRWAQNLLMTVHPLIAAGLALSSGYHGWFYTDATRLVTAPAGSYVVYDYGPAFYVNAALLYGVILTTLVLLFRAATKAQQSGQFRYWLLFVLAVVPTAGNVAHLGFGITFWGYDPTPFLFAILIIVYVVMLVSDTTLDLRALARQQVFNALPQTIFVISPALTIMAGNVAAQDYLSDHATADDGARTAEAELRRLFQDCLGTDSGRCSAREIGGRYFDIDLQPIQPAVGTGQPPMGWVMIATDVTASVYLQAELARTARSAAEEAARDPLTGLSNRRPLEPRFEDLVDDARREGQHLHVVLMDIDRFKSINDRYGHDVGDASLIAVAETLTSVFRDGDPIFRVGGEEFLALILAMPREALVERLDRARSMLAVAHEHDDRLPEPVTFSAGLAEWPRDGITLEQLTIRADRRLLAAKRTGRDRVIWADGVAGGKRTATRRR